MTWAQGGRTFTGQYKYIDNENVRLDMMGDLGARAIVLKDVSIRNNQLNVTLDGQPIVFDAVGKSSEGGATTTPRVVTSGPNLMPNPSFESGSGNDPAQWWRAEGRDQFSLVWDKTTAHSGKRSLAVTIAKPATGNDGTNWISDIINLNPESEYELSLWYRSTAPAAPPEGPAIAGLGSVGSGGGFVRFDFSPANDWTFVRTTFQGEALLQLAFYLSLTNNAYEGGVWIDDISLKEVVK